MPDNKYIFTNTMNNKQNKSEINLQLKNDLDYNTPVLFNKKSKRYVVKPLTYINSDTGITRHFTPAAQEWFNSIYSYNHNYIKSLPVADTSLMKLLKSYFNFQINRKVLKTKTMPTRFKRLSTKRVFVGKGELKHTSSKVIITFYVHNTERMYLSRAIKLVFKSLYNPKRRLIKFITKDRNNKEIVSYNRPFTLEEYLALPDHYNKWYIDHVASYIEIKNLYLSNLLLQYRILTKLISIKAATQKDLTNIFIPLYENIHSFDYPSFASYMQKVRTSYLSGLTRFKYLLRFNNVKFTKSFMFELTRLVQGLYNKKVEFNIVNLKKMHLNSDIFTQAVSLKLRNRDNRLYRVLKSSLRKIKLPSVNRLSEKQNKFNKNEFLVNKIRNNNITSMFKDNANDPLSNLLLDYFPSADNLKVNVVRRSSIKKRSTSLINYVLKSLKHVKMAGIRIEAKGRLTRRFTASRSVFKMKWKGGLKNVDSSFKGLSAIMLRGHVKSNVQYSTINSKNRNGAFGVKGWVSNK